VVGVQLAVRVEGVMAAACAEDQGLFAVVKTLHADVQTFPGGYDGGLGSGLAGVFTVEEFSCLECQIDDTWCARRLRLKGFEC